MGLANKISEECFETIFCSFEVRKWLAKFRESKTGFRAEFVPHGLTEQRRTELQNLIAKMRDRFPVIVISIIWRQKSKMVHVEF